MTNGSQFEKILEPGRIGQMETRNRIVMPPMVTNMGTRDGFITQRIEDHYEARARGGVGLIIVECACVDYPVGKNYVHQIAIDDDKFLAGLSELAQVIKKHGAKAAIQLHHAGAAGHPYITGHQTVAPSAVTRPGCEPPRELTISEIENLVTCFARAAVRAKKAGFDGVEIHAAHGYLLAEFLSSCWNKRQDIYGGELRNRARLLLQVLKGIREQVGGDYSVWCRVNGREYGMENGITIGETQELAPMLQDAGADAVHVSGVGLITSVYAYIQRAPMCDLPGLLLPLAEAVKKVVSIPVIAVGRITPEIGERVVREGKADFIAMGRGLLADPEVPNKLASGRLDDIRPCIACNVCLDKYMPSETGVQCVVNSAVGKGGKYSISKAEKIKKVLIAGGGPAGLETARVAALRGHEVVLYEGEPRLGGQALLAAMPPYKEKIQEFTNYLVGQVMKLGVKIELGKKVDQALVKDTKPDVVVVATGARPFIPAIPGVNRDNVATAQDVLTEKVRVGDRVVFIGGGQIGAEVAEFLAEKGKKVTLTTLEEEIAFDLAISVRVRLVRRLEDKDVTMLTGVKYEQLTHKGLIIITKEGDKRTIEADTIVLATGVRRDTDLVRVLQGEGIEIHLAGDCLEPRGIKGAIEDGFCVARTI